MDGPIVVQKASSWLDVQARAEVTYYWLATRPEEYQKYAKMVRVVVFIAALATLCQTLAASIALDRRQTIPLSGTRFYGGGLTILAYNDLDSKCSQELTQSPMPTQAPRQSQKWIGRSPHPSARRICGDHLLLRASRGVLLEPRHGQFHRRLEQLAVIPNLPENFPGRPEVLDSEGQQPDRLLSRN